ncbi:MAG: AAA family ATPase, partial [Bacteroidota bacterium]
SIKSNIGNLIFESRNGYSLSIGDNQEMENISQYSKNGDSNALKNYLNSFDNNEVFDNQKRLKPFHLEFDSQGIVHDVFSFTNYNTFIRKYNFKRFTSAHEEKTNIFFTNFLLSPNGYNLFALIQTHPQIRALANDFFKEYNLDFVLNRKENILEIQRRIDDFVDTISFSSIADTLQRIIFHLAAVESNKNAILIFEEPEAHSFPPYISMFAQKVIQAKENQFFIATHSPYLLNEIIENCPKDEIAIFVCSYKDHQTHARLLKPEELEELDNYGVDIFFNIAKYEK